VLTRDNKKQLFEEFLAHARQPSMPQWQDWRDLEAVAIKRRGVDRDQAIDLLRLNLHLEVKCPAHGHGSSGERRRKSAS